MSQQNLLLSLILLSEKIRQSSPEELRYLIVNATRDIVKYSHAALFEYYSYNNNKSLTALGSVEKH